MVLCNVDQRKEDYKKQLQATLNETGSAVVVLATEMLDEDLDPFGLRRVRCWSWTAGPTRWISMPF